MTAIVIAFVAFTLALGLSWHDKPGRFADDATGQKGKGGSSHSSPSSKATEDTGAS